MRSISSTLKNALANQEGEVILRVKTWTNQADYITNPTAPDNIWDVAKFSIYNTSATVKLVTENNYLLSAFDVFIIERGVLLEGIEHTIESGLYFVEDYQEDFGYINVKGSSYPNLKINIAAGDGTYQQVIEAFCAAIGKTASFKRSTDPWLNYQFLPDGKSVSLNKASLFENMLRQKYTILVYEDQPNNLVFYTQDSYSGIRLISVAWSPAVGLFAAVSVDGQLLTSDNGADWSQQTIPETNQWQAVCWSPTLGLFCAVAGSGTHRVMTSPDGITWTARTAAAANLWQTVCWSPELNLFCALSVTGANRVMTSPDGINWTSRTAASASPWVSITWSPALHLFCAVADSAVMTSPDGITWTSRTAAAANQWYSVCWSPELGLFCAVASSGTNRVMTSPDGITWTARTAAAANQWHAVCWSPELGLFCATASSGASRVMTSPDGITWTARTAAAAKTWYALCWSGELGLFAAVAIDSNGNAMTSTDGTSWALQTISATYNFTYQDGPVSRIQRGTAGVHYLWRDENDTVNTGGDPTLPQWNLGYLESTDSPPITYQDAYYRMFLQKSPVRLDVTDSDKIHFTPAWSIDPSKTIDAMCFVSEHLDLDKTPSWWQEYKAVDLFSHTEGGQLPGTIERVAAYTPLVTSGFDRFLTDSVNNLQTFANWVNDYAMNEDMVNTLITAAKSALYPVGSIYTSVVSTNPAALLGFGTWSAFGTGRTLVGIDPAQTEFDTVEEIGGAKTHTLATGEMPAHSHTQDPHNHTQDPHTHVQNSHNHLQDAHTHTQNSHNHLQDVHTHTQNSHNHTQDAHTHTQNSHNHTQDPHNHTQDAHTHAVLGRDSSTAGTGNRAMNASATGATHDPASGSTTATNQAATATNQAATATNQNTTATNQAATATNQNATATNQAATATNQNTTATNQLATATNQNATATNQAATATNQNTGGGGAHNNLQPYIVVYMWKRTG